MHRLAEVRWSIVVLLSLTSCVEPPSDVPPDVEQAGFRLSISGSAIQLVPGESVQLFVAPTDGTGQLFRGLYTLTWSSSANSVMSVTATGLVTASGVGTAMLTATATRVGNVLSLYLNGALWLRYEDPQHPEYVAHGSGAGIGGFIRPGAVHNKFGFRRMRVGAL